MNTKKIEAVGVKTTIITDEYAGSGWQEPVPGPMPILWLTRSSPVVTPTWLSELPKLDNVIGTLDYVDKIAGGHAGSLARWRIEAELQVITGATNEMGFNCLSAR